MPDILPSSGPRQTIVIVAGRREEAACGVWDYSVLLAEALRRTGAEVRLVNARDWSLRGFLALARSLRGEKARILIQYPSSAFEKRLLPYFLPFALLPHRTAVTIHEFSYKRLPAKILTCLPMAFAGSVVFTSPVEAAAARHSPRRRREVAVIPIGSNIPAVAAREKAIDLVYFGIIRENGRLESFLEVLERLPRGSVRAAILGSVAAGSGAYAKAIEARAAAVGATLRLEADAEEVAELLSASKVALLPYDDGISSRRGTALAAMA
ncbi:hypothetical protein, partial [Aureimonas endophytica]|uniref:hypothetical protein n=1 Tax=Aureimonas endophytica TaxID=2027858 RepID=UPI001AEEC3F2